MYKINGEGINNPSALLVLVAHIMIPREGMICTQWTTEKETSHTKFTCSVNTEVPAMTPKHLLYLMSAIPTLLVS